MFWALLTLAIAQSAGCHGAATAYDCAVAQVERQEFAAAIDTLTQQVLATAPANLKALNLLGIALTSAGRVDEAAARFQQALTIDPGFTPARKNLAINEFARGKLSDAQRDFEQVLARAPDDEVTHLHLGEIAFQRNQPRAAVAHYEKAGARVSQNPTWREHYATSAFDAGVMQGRAGAYREAAECFAKAERAGYKDRYAVGYNQVLMLVNAGDATSATAAIRIADGLLAQGPAMKKAELFSVVAQAYLKTERIKEAYDALREATRVEPEAVDHYVDLAMICVDHQNFDLGLEIVGIGLQHRPESSLLHLQRGVLYAMKGSIEQAAASFEQASKVAPDDPVPYVAQSMIWMQTGQATKAVEVLRARTRTHAQANHDDAVIFYALGVALLRAGAAPDDAAGDEATNAFASAVRLNPEFPQARAELGKLLLKRGDTEGAIAHLEKAVALDPENAAPAYVLAQAYRKRGDVDRARQLLQRVSTINTRERGDDPDHELKRVIIRIVRDGAATKANGGAAESVREPPQ
jgi:tetratricopeptide (TPR) repeat protein